METPLPASQGAQQPKRLAVSRRLSILRPQHTDTLPQAFGCALLERLCQEASQNNVPTPVRPTEIQGELEAMGRDP